MATNVVIMSGRLATDPELKTTTSGKDVARFSLAVDRSYTKGEERKADFFTVIVWGGAARFVEQYFSKGSGIELRGRLETRSYEDKEGNKRTVTEIIAEDVRFPVGGNKQQGDQTAEPKTAPAAAPAKPAAQPTQAPPASAFGYPYTDDEQLPF